MRKAIHNDLIVGIASSIILTTLGTLLAPTILKAMGTPEDVLPNSISYFRIYFIGVSSVILYNTFASILQALGDSKKAFNVFNNFFIIKCRTWYIIY